MATFMILMDRMYDSIDSVLSRADVPETFKNELRGYEKLRRKENLEEELVIPFSTLRNLQKYLVNKGNCFTGDINGIFERVRAPYFI